MKNQILQNSAVSFALSVILSATGFQALNAAEPSGGCHPIIALNTDVAGDRPCESSVENTYIEAIRQAGGIPVLLPPLASDDLSCVLSHIDGVLMIGGDDYPPSLYNEKAHPSVSLMKKSRSDFDMLLMQKVLADKTMPFLGICAGSQVLNIASGGSLTQDIPSARPESKIKHASPQGWKKGFNHHQVIITKDSKLANVLGLSELSVVTCHHQCVDRPGTGITVIARAPDGVPEAIEKTGDRFVLGVQYHPERDYAANHKVFDELVRQASLRQKARMQSAN